MRTRCNHRDVHLCSSISHKRTVGRRRSHSRCRPTSSRKAGRRIRYLVGAHLRRDWLSHICVGLAHVCAGTRIVQIVRDLVWSGLQVFGALVCVSCLSAYGDGDAAAWTKQDGSFDSCRWCIDATQYNTLQRKPAAWTR